MLQEEDTITVDSIKQHYASFSVIRKLDLPSNLATITYLTMRSIGSGAEGFLGSSSPAKETTIDI
jgi:hypothetical protein